MFVNMHTERLSVLLLVLVHLPKYVCFYLFSLNELKYSSPTGYQEEKVGMPQVFNLIQGRGSAELY